MRPRRGDGHRRHRIDRAGGIVGKQKLAAIGGDDGEIEIERVARANALGRHAPASRGEVDHHAPRALVAGERAAHGNRRRGEGNVGRPLGGDRLGDSGERNRGVNRAAGQLDSIDARAVAGVVDVVDGEVVRLSLLPEKGD